MTIGTSSTRCSPRLRTRSRASSSGGNSADIFPILVLHRHLRPLFQWVHLRLRLGVHLRCSLPAGLIRPLQRLDSFIHSTGSGDRLASPEPVCVQPLHHSVLITLHELVHACPALVGMWLCHSLARAPEGLHPGGGTCHATSCFRVYLRLCGAHTIASDAGITTAGTGGGLTSGFLQ